MPERRAGVEKAGFCRVLFFLAVEIGGRRTMVFFFLSGGRFFNGAEAELRRDGVAVFVGPCAFCLFFRVVRSCFLFWFWKFLFGIDKRRVFLYDVSINRNKNSNWRNIHVRRIY